MTKTNTAKNLVALAKLKNSDKKYEQNLARIFCYVNFSFCVQTNS